jgi:hypothetical protein
MNNSPLADRRATLTIAGLIALASMIIVLAVTGTRESHAATHDAHPASLPVQRGMAVAFHDQMRALREAHGSWTHMVITSSSATSPTSKPRKRPCCRTRSTLATRSSPTTAAPPATS